jgi:uncharacterized Rmd1/YagE family protein
MPRKKKRPSLIKQLDDTELFNETDFIKDAHIDVDDFNEEAVRHPELHYHYGKLHSFGHYGKLHSFGKKANAVAELKVHLAKLDMQTALAAAHERIRKERTEAGEKCTEALLDNESRLSPEYTESLATLFSKRTEILKTVGHLLSRELDTGVSIHKSSAREASADFSARLRADVEAAKEVVRQNRENKK